MGVDQIIDHYALQPSPFGGWFKQNYVAQSPDGGRPLATVIYYLLTQDGPSCIPHRSGAESIHYFHMGSPITVLTIDAKEKVQFQQLGSDVGAGQQLQLVVPPGTWKGLHLESGSHAFISEAVVPGFLPEDTELADATNFRSRFSSNWAQMRHYFGEKG